MALRILTSARSVRKLVFPISANARCSCRRDVARRCATLSRSMSLAYSRSIILTVGPSPTLRDGARQMAERSVGAAVVLDPDQPGPGILTERDLLDAVGTGQDVDTETVCNHLSTNLTFASPDWSLETAAE